MTINLTLTHPINIMFAHPVTIQIAEPAKLGEILTAIQKIQKDLKELKMTDAELLVLLGKVDETTTKIGTNLQVVGDAQQQEANTIQEISDDIDRLVAAGNGISPEAATKFQALADRLQASSDKSDLIAAQTLAQVPVLQSIAAKSEPVVPPPPPAPVIE